VIFWLSFTTFFSRFFGLFKPSLGTKVDRVREELETLYFIFICFLIPKRFFNEFMCSNTILKSKYTPHTHTPVLRTQWANRCRWQSQCNNRIMFYKEKRICCCTNLDWKIWMLWNRSQQRENFLFWVRIKKELHFCSGKTFRIITNVSLEVFVIVIVQLCRTIAVLQDEGHFLSEYVLHDSLKICATHFF
jgi:hypothetical protein